MIRRDGDKRNRRIDQIAYDDYLRSSRWRFVRSVRKRIDGYKCRCCFKQTQLEVHHASYRHRNRSVIGEIKDTITLCAGCHRAIHSQ